jgi:hypothetical protein
MKRVEAESTGPVEGAAALAAPPRPPHRRVSVSRVFTFIVLVGTVVTIYAVFPARHNLLMTEAIAHHRDPGAAWDLVTPSRDALRTWMIGAIGKDAPLPGAAATVVGARQLDILNRAAALIRLRIGDDEVTYLVQRARGIAPEVAERVERGEAGDGDPDGSAGRSGGKGPRGVELGGSGGKAPRGVERGEAGDGGPDGLAGRAGRKAPRGVEPGAGGKAARGIEPVETGGRDPDGFAGRVGRKASRGVEPSETGGKAPRGIDGALRAVAWRSGRFTVVAVGADATAAHWRAGLR